MRRAVGDAVRKLDPRQMAKNPVMFIVEIGSVFTTVLAVARPSVFAWLTNNAMEVGAKQAVEKFKGSAEFRNLVEAAKAEPEGQIITLRGEVLPIGGLKEKILAAHRGGIKMIICPKENEKDLKDIPKEVLKDL